jgi:hypothetical protein
VDKNVSGVVDPLFVAHRHAPKQRSVRLTVVDGCNEA